MDNLENLYKKSFEDFERKPRADFWEQLEPVIPSKPPKRSEKWGLIWAYFAGMFSMLLLVVGYHFFIDNSPKVKISALPIKMSKGLTFSDKNSIATQETIGQIAIPPKNISDANRLGVYQGKKWIASSKKEINQNDKKDNDLFIKAITNAIVEEAETANSPTKMVAAGDKKKPKIVEFNYSPATTEKRRLKWRTQRLVKKVAKGRQFDLYRVDTLAMHLLHHIDIGRKGQKKLVRERPFLAMQYTPSAIGKLKIDSRTANQTFTKSANIYQTKGVSVDVGILFDRNWLVQVGYAQHTFNMERYSSIFVPTVLMDAIEGTNGFTQQYQFDNQAITENVSGRLTVLSRHNDFRAGDLFEVNTRIEQPLRLFGVSSQVGYRFNLAPRWDLSPKIGFSATWGEKGGIQLTDVSLADDRQQLLFAAIDNTNVTTFNFIEGLVSSELAYRASRRLYLTATPQFRFGFKPYFTNFERSATHRFGQLQLGIRIHL